MSSLEFLLSLIIEPFQGMTVAPDGTAYFTTSLGVWSRSTTGVYSRLAGTGILGAAGYSGDGGPAISSQVNGASGIVRLFDGSLLFADRLNNRIRKISPFGIISTIGGTGATGSSGDSGPATTIAFNSPTALALDGTGNLLVGESGGHRVMAINLNTGMASRLAGGGSHVPALGGDPLNASFGELVGVDVDALGDVVFVDRTNGAVWGIHAGALALKHSGLSSPSAISRMTDGSLLVSELGMNRVWKLPVSGSPFVVAGSGALTATPGPDATPATAMALFHPGAISTDAAGFWFLENDGFQVRRVTWTD